MKITSIFENNQTIPDTYTCTKRGGKNINPEITISGYSKETKSLVLIIDDPDAPLKTWVHWVLFNIEPDSSGITVIKENSVPSGAVQGKNDSNADNTYGGPCPPSGTHRYYFKAYALDAKLNLDQNSGKQDVLSTLKDHTLGHAKLIGLVSAKN